MTLKPMTPTKHPGVHRRKDGLFVIRVTGRTCSGKSVQHVKTLDPRTTEEEAVRTASMMREQLRQEVALLEMGATASHRQRDTNLAPSVTIEEYARQWYRSKSGRLKPGTRHRYAENLDKRILPRIGHLYVGNVCRQMVESWATWLEGLLKPDGKPYADDTLKGWWRTFSLLMKDLATDFGLPDPTLRVRPPESNIKGLRESRTLTQDELQRFLAAVKTISPNRYAEVILLAMTGMRPGEVYALKWDSVDCDRELFIVRRGISDRQLTETTKTKVPRKVPMHPILAEVLREHRQRLIRMQHPGLATNFVFPSDNGKMRLSGSTEKVYEKGRAAAKLDVKVGHQVLRRTLNTLMTREGVDRITQRAIIGHSSEKMTELYNYVDMEDKKGAILKVFGGEKGEDSSKSEPC